MISITLTPLHNDSYSTITEERHIRTADYACSICGEFPTEPNLTKIGIWVGVADIINHTKFGNDRSREYKVTEGRILPCSIGTACRL